MGKLRHIVLFKIHDEITETVFEQAVKELMELGEGHNGLEAWHVNVSTDTRKGRIIIEEAVFTTEADYKVFHDSDKHVKVGNLMKTVADWWVGDYII